MTTSSFSCAHLTDKDLLSEVVRLAGIERHATAQLIASLAELDARRLYLGEGCSSLFTYCTQILHLSEHAAYGRIEAARAARRFPVILEMLAAGEVTVTTVRLLSSMLTTENHRKVLAEAAHKSKREVEEIAARLRPRPDVPSAVRKLPEPRTTIPAPLVAAQLPSASPGWVSATVAPDLPSSATRPAVKPLAPERYKIQFTVGRETHEKLRRVQNLLRHSLPDGDPAVVFDRALTVLLAQLEKEKLAATSRPREGRAFTSSSRHIPAVVKRAVWKRDGGQCAFRGKRGRCTERGLLEFHHVSPYAAGGAAVEENIELRCAAHNQYEADLFFGPSDGLVVRERSSAPYGANSGREKKSA